MNIKKISIYIKEKEKEDGKQDVYTENDDRQNDSSGTLSSSRWYNGRGWLRGESLSRAGDSNW